MVLSGQRLAEFRLAQVGDERLDRRSGLGSANGSYGV